MNKKLSAEITKLPIKSEELFEKGILPYYYSIVRTYGPRGQFSESDNLYVQRMEGCFIVFNGTHTGNYIEAYIPLLTTVKTEEEAERFMHKKGLELAQERGALNSQIEDLTEMSPNYEI